MTDDTSAVCANHTPPVPFRSVMLLGQESRSLRAGACTTDSIVQRSEVAPSLVLFIGQTDHGVASKLLVLIRLQYKTPYHDAASATAAAA
jgi:hypothetical protein